MLSSHHRYDALDGMRGVAALAVAAFHFTQRETFTLFYNAPLAVDFFFMLSGFVVAHAYGARLFRGMGVLEYLAKRLVRMYPLFALGIAIGIPTLVARNSSGVVGLPSDSLGLCAAAHAFFLPCFEAFNANARSGSSGALFPSNPPAWSLFFEMVACLSFPLLCRMGSKALFAFVAVSWVCFLGGGLWLGSSGGLYSFYLDAGWNAETFLIGFARALFGFGCGALLYRFRSFSPTPFLKPWALYLGLALAIAFPFSVKGGYHAIVVTFFAPLFVLAGSSVSCAEGISLWSARLLGRLSYPVYCLHVPVGGAVFLAADKANIPFAATFGLAVACTLVVSYVVVALVDEPIRGWLSRHLSALLLARRVRTAQDSMRIVAMQEAVAPTEPQVREVGKQASRTV